MEDGMIPRVLALTCGDGTKDSLIEGVFVDEQGKAIDQCDFNNLRDHDTDRAGFLELLENRKPDVIGIAGFDINTRRLLENVRELLKEHSRKSRDDIYVTVVNDEVANLAKRSRRYQEEFPSRVFSDMKLYC